MNAKNTKCITSALASLDRNAKKIKELFSQKRIIATKNLDASKNYEKMKRRLKRMERLSRELATKEERIQKRIASGDLGQEELQRHLIEPLSLKPLKLRYTDTRASFYRPTNRLFAATFSFSDNSVSFNQLDRFKFKDSDQCSKISDHIEKKLNDEIEKRSRSLGQLEESIQAIHLDQKAAEINSRIEKINAKIRAASGHVDPQTLDREYENEPDDGQGEPGQ